jgi:hypothetical protein
MMPLESLLDQLYGGQERLTRDEIYRRAVTAQMPAQALTVLDGLPEGEYAQDEVSGALAEISGDTGSSDGGTSPSGPDGDGVAASELSDEDLMRELETLHRTRHETLRHGSGHALERHTERTAELEEEYLRRFPEREVDPERERAGARQRT